MISLPPRAQLSNNPLRNLENGHETTPPVQVCHRHSQRGCFISVPSAIPERAAAIEPSAESFAPAERKSSHRPSLYSTESPLSGSTLCPTPQSAPREYENGYFKDALLKEPEDDTSFEETLDPASYTVETIQPEDDAGRVALWKRRVYRLSPLTTIISIIAYFLYYTYRIHCTLDAQRVFNQVYVMAWIFITAEGCVACKCSCIPPISTFIAKK